MNISSMQSINQSSLQHAVGIAVLKKAMLQDSQNAAGLINTLHVSNTKSTPYSEAPFKGTKIDVRL